MTESVPKHRTPVPGPKEPLAEKGAEGGRHITLLGIQKQAVTGLNPKDFGLCITVGSTKCGRALVAPTQRLMRELSEAG